MATLHPHSAELSTQDSDAPIGMTAMRPLDVPMPQPEHIKTFQQLYANRFGEQLSNEQALQEFISLLTIVRYQQENARYGERQVPGKQKK